MKRPLGFMSIELFRHIVNQAADLGDPELRLFNFGEPLLHPGLTEMIRYAKINGLAVNFQTNGLLLTEDRVRELLDAGLDYFGVSVNGLTDAEYSTIRPGFQLATLRERLSRLKEIAATCGRKIHLHINAQILTEDREDRQADIARYVAEWAGIPDSLSVSGMSLFDGISYLRNGTVDENSNHPPACKPDAQVFCAEPFDRLVIKWDGRATPCCADFDARYVLGDLNHESLADIWRSTAAQRLRNLVRLRRYGSSLLCRDCPKRVSNEFTVLFQKPAAAP